MHDPRVVCSHLSLACKMSGVFREVDFVVLLIGRIVSLLQGSVLSNNITIDDKDGGAIINVKIALWQRKER